MKKFMNFFMFIKKEMNTLPANIKLMFYIMIVLLFLVIGIFIYAFFIDRWAFFSIIQLLIGFVVGIGIGTFIKKTVDLLAEIMTRKKS